MALSRDAEVLLENVVKLGGFGVYADSIIESADLLRAGYVRAEPDYDGPRLIPTDKGIAAAKRRKLV